MTWRMLFVLSGALALAGCGPTMSDDEIDRLKNDISAAAEAQGLTVRQISLRAESNDRAVGDATVALRDDPSREVGWSCGVQRLEGPRFRWRCAPATQPGSTAARASTTPPETPPVSLNSGREALAGRWSDTGDCNVVTLLGEDGSFVAPNGARGNWDVQGSQLTLSGPNGSVTLSVVLEGPNTMTVTTSDGTTSRSTRC